jgi:hypothetical protein
MPCRVCVELELYVVSAQKPDQPDMLKGLNDRALSNRIRQREEGIQKHQISLEKHRKVCGEHALSAG